MKNVSSKKWWITGITQARVKPLPISLLKKVYNGKPDKDFVKLNQAPRNGHANFSIYLLLLLKLNIPVQNLGFELCTGLLNS